MNNTNQFNTNNIILSPQEENKNYYENLKSHIYTDEKTGKIVHVFKALQDIHLEDNKLIYNTDTIDLDNTSLKNIDSEIFRLKAKDSMDILITLKKHVTDPYYINKICNRINFLILLQSPSESDYEEINSYIQLYFHKDALNKLYSNDILHNQVENIRQYLSLCYHEEYANREIAKYIKLEFDKKVLELNDNTSNSNNLTKVRKNQYNMIVLPSESDNLEKLAGFASTTLVISITVSLGIVIAILTLFL